LPREEAAAALTAAGLLRDPSEVAAVADRVRREQLHYLRGRVRRCWQESTEFSRRLTLFGSEHRRRDADLAGRWHRGGRELARAWFGQRVLQLRDGRDPQFPRFFRKWWWLGGGGALYVPAAWSDQRIAAEVAEAVAGFDWFRARSEKRDLEAT
jgi:hypothetical protein